MGKVDGMNSAGLTCTRNCAPNTGSPRDACSPRGGDGGEAGGGVLGLDPHVVGPQAGEVGRHAEGVAERDSIATPDAFSSAASSTSCSGVTRMTGSTVAAMTCTLGRIIHPLPRVKGGEAPAARARGRVVTPPPAL